MPPIYKREKAVPPIYNPTSLLRKHVGELDFIYVQNLRLVNGKRNGFGAHTYADGSTYEGYWHFDKRDGQGKLTDKTGNVIKSGEWKDDELNWLIWLSYR